MYIALARIDALADALDTAAMLAAAIAADARTRSGEPGAREYARERLRCLVESVGGILGRAGADDPAPSMVADAPAGGIGDVLG